MDEPCTNMEDLDKKLQELLQEGWTHFDNGNYELSAEYSIKAIPICKELKYEKQYADLHMTVGKSYLLCGNYPEGRKYLEKAIDLHTKIKQYSTVSSDLEILADIYRQEKKYMNSIDLYEKSIEFKKREGIGSLNAEIYIKIATCYLYLENNIKSYENLFLALNITKDLEKSENNLVLNATISQGLGVCASKLSWHEKAITHYQNALNVYDNLEDTMNVILLLKLLGDEFNKKNDPKAFMYYQESVDLIEQKQIDDFVSLLESIYHMADIKIKTQKYQEAIAFSSKGLNLSKDSKNENWTIQFLLQTCLSYIYSHQFDKSADILCSPETRILIEKFGTEEENKLFNELITLNENARNNPSGKK
ncbi:MAG: tetratricopeptide repeat protein [Candidatus Lokiarchaeota archaeon]|nr:tetratricopeptide repeat protein [Candidatus Lokiarchaeota archaeon]